MISNRFTLSEIANVVDCEHKTAPTVDASEYYSIRTTDISNGRLDLAIANRVSYETYTEWTRRAVPQTGNLILAREAPVGEVGYVKDGHKVCLGQRTVLIQVTSESVDNKYLLYHLVNPTTKHDLQIRSTGSVVAHLNMKDIRNFEVTLPSLPEQKAIAAVLSSLDDKIDLLHRQNKTLEALAQTLFRHWFVDGAEDDWRQGRLDDLVEFAYGKGLKSEIRTGRGYPVVGSSGVVDFHSEYLVEAPGIVIGRKGTLGEVIYMSENFYPIDTTYFIKSKTGSEGMYFEYFLLKTINFKDMNTDSAVPGLNRNIALATEVAVPPHCQIAKFNESIHPVFQKIITNKNQIRTLEKLRDTLLPKLMSGEARVRL